MKVRGSLLGVLAALTLALFSVTGVLAQSATPEALDPAASPAASPIPSAKCQTLLGIGMPDDGCLIVINGIADGGELDVYINGLKAVDSLTFDDVSGYFSLPADTYTFALVPAGASIENAVLSVADTEISAGTAYELAAVGTLAAPQLLVNSVDLSPLPPGDAGSPVSNTRIRAIHAAPDAGNIDVAFIGGDIAELAFDDLAFPQVSDYLEKTAGNYRIILDTTERDFVTFDLGELNFGADTVNSIYAIGDVANGDLRLLNVTVDLSDGSSTARTIPPTLVSDIVEVSRFSIYEGNCAQLSAQVAFELTGTGYDGAGPGTLAPWGSGDKPAGALGVVPVSYGEGVVDDLNFGDLLGGRTVSVVVHDAATGGVVACGEVGGVVESADRFWQHDRLIIGIHALDGSGISGTATFIEDTGVLTDKITVSVALVTETLAMMHSDA